MIIQMTMFVFDALLVGLPVAPYGEKLVPEHFFPVEHFFYLSNTFYPALSTLLVEIHIRVIQMLTFFVFDAPNLAFLFSIRQTCYLCLLCVSAVVNGDSDDDV